MLQLTLAMGYLLVLGAIAIIDLRTLRAPNRLVYPALGLAVVGSLALGAGGATEALLGGLIAFGVLLAVAIVGRGAMGLGDVKVGALGGLAVGASAALPMLAVTFVSGGALAAAMLGLRVRRRGDVIAFTPFLLLGVVVSMLWFDPYLLR